ncbi:hypothetical protein Q3A66_11105 [Hymenobacter sp. BT770]|uniref:hypothetical protein n=1 Tax=Hymenobacter sp. BT770 TaxID=2886942 RepID=UPI001D11FE1D|nr:hypothetical protein [Hymenobacter sp. BT770]MCC3154297.1 hypothetical protein [Hymenobacter sp. BT770]MDO3415618.1 hypothetical protein [Hymenobacter sp. BT770]
MQEFVSRGPGFLWAQQPRLKALSLALATLALVIGGSAAQQPAPAPKTAKLSQGQVAWQFLRAVLRANYTAAYARLAPEMHRAVSLERFEAAARPIWKTGQRHGQQIELYKLGVRLGAGGSSRMFYAFTFASDSASKSPSAVLEVTFRDTTARTVLGFAQRLAPPATPKRPRKPSGRNGSGSRR